MKRVFYFITGLLLISLMGMSYANAQISAGGTPKSISLNLRDNYDVKSFAAIDVEKAMIEDAANDAKGALYRYGKTINVGLNINTAGTWTEVPDGEIWRLKLKSAGAKALGVYFDDFWLPKGGELYLYNEDKSQILGAYTSANNHPSGIFAIELVQGESVTLEYFQPSKQKEQAIISISEMSYAYRSVHFLFRGTDAFGDSESCEVDANCPEGDDWRDQQRGVARISVKSGSDYGWCSGSLVNNTLGDCKPYFLTADHCADGASVTDVLSWVFYFNYELTGCNDPSQTEPSPSTMTGAVRKARGGWNGSDFYLVMFTSYIPLDYNLYFNGWRSTNVASPSGVGIHHPAGDVKKISTYTSTLSNYGSTHWSVGWSGTSNGHGVTEGGSSGSPLFNNNGRIVGTLTGGSSYCSAPTAHDIYGKVSYSWASNGSSASSRLKDWLDPNNDNPGYLDGKDEDCTDFPIIVDFYVESTSVVQGTMVHFTNLTLKNPAYSTSYFWEFEGVSQAATTIVTSPNRTFNQVGTFPVTLTATNSNGDTDSKTIYITVSTNSIDNVINSDFEVYPNPSHDKVFVKLNNSDLGKKNIRIYNMTGQIIYNQTRLFDEVDGIDVSAIPAGMYFIEVVTESNTYSKKLSIIK